MVRIEEDCLELRVASPDDISRLRRWIGQVNGPSFSQPFLVEGRPDASVSTSATPPSAVRTRHGIA